MGKDPITAEITLMLICDNRRIVKSRVTVQVEESNDAASGIKNSAAAR